MIEFDPGTWAKGASAVLEEAALFHTTATATLTASSDVGAAGAAGGATLVDQAIATVLPPVFDQVGETITLLAEGLGQEADLMRQTAAAYAETEDVNRELGAAAAPTGPGEV